MQFLVTLELVVGHTIGTLSGLTISQKLISCHRAFLLVPQFFIAKAVAEAARFSGVAGI